MSNLLKDRLRCPSKPLVSIFRSGNTILRVSPFQHQRFNMSSGATATHDLTPSKLFDLKGKVALVTGGGTGIGLMAAQALAAAGAKVYIASRRQEVLEKAAKVWSDDTKKHPEHGQLIPLTFDQTDKSSIESLAKEIGQKEKCLHILVNNAGVAGPKHALEKGEESTEDFTKELTNHGFADWNKVYETNVVGFYFNAVTFLPLLKAATEQSKGWSAGIVNITSMSGITSESQNHVPYNVSKGAANHLNAIMAKEFTRVKIRVNAIAPGVFPSEMTTQDSDHNQKSTLSSEGFKDEKEIPAGRPGTEEDMAQTVLFVATNQYLNGQVITIDGGYLLTHASAV